MIVAEPQLAVGDASVGRRASADLGCAERSFEEADICIATIDEDVRRYFGEAFWNMHLDTLVTVC